MADQKNPQNANVTDPNHQVSQDNKWQWVFGGSVDAFETIAQQGIHQPDEQKNQQEGLNSPHTNEPIDPFLQSWNEHSHPKEENVDVPDPFLIDEPRDDLSTETKIDDSVDESTDNNTHKEANGDAEKIDSVQEKEVLDAQADRSQETMKQSEDPVVEKDSDSDLTDLDPTIQEESIEDEPVLHKKDQHDSIDEDENEVEEVDEDVVRDTIRKPLLDEDDKENAVDDKDTEEWMEDKNEVEEETVTEEHENEPVKDQSPLQEKFHTLLALIEQTISIYAKMHNDSFSLVWADNDISFVEYTFEQSAYSITIHKNALDKKTHENEEHILVFTLDRDQEDSLHVVVDDTLLFNEKKIVDNQSAQVQILDKLSKFLFLVGQEKKSLEKAYEEQKEKESQKEKTQTFRNF